MAVRIMNQESSVGKNKKNLNSLFLLLNSYAFTLVELLVVIAIMGLIGAYVLSNYGSFGEDQKLKSAALDVASLLRQAQTNATTNVICAGGNWQAEFTDTVTIKLQCSAPLRVIKTLILNEKNPNIAISAVSVVTGSNCPSIPPPLFAVTFAPLTGKINLVDSRCVSLSVTLTNGTNSKALKIEQGGRIYVP